MSRPTPNYFKLANALDSLFQGWRLQDDELSHALSGLEPEDRDEASEVRDRERISANRNIQLKELIEADPSIAILRAQAALCGEMEQALGNLMSTMPHRYDCVCCYCVDANALLTRVRSAKDVNQTENLNTK